MFTTKVIYTAGMECTLAILCTGTRPYCAAECICEQIAAPAGHPRCCPNIADFYHVAACSVAHEPPRPGPKPPRPLFQAVVNPSLCCPLSRSLEPALPFLYRGINGFTGYQVWILVC